MRTIFCTYCLFVFLQPQQAQLRPLEKKNHSVNRTLEEMRTYSGFANAGIGFLAVDLHTAEPVSSFQPDMALRPASTLKLLSTAAALELLGPGHRFETFIGYTGTQDTLKGILDGRLVIRGGGDPSLGSSHVDTAGSLDFLELWAGAVEAAGIDSVTGPVVGDARCFSWEMVPATWSWGNMGQYYGAGPCGLSVFDNAFSAFFDTGENPGDPAGISGVWPNLPELQIENRVTSDTIGYDNAYVFGAPYRFDRYITGELPVGRKRFEVKGSLPDPTLTAAMMLDSLLELAGIATGGDPTTMRRLSEMDDPDPPSGFTPLWSTLSPPLLHLIRLTNTRSINLYAEHLLLHAGLAMGAAPVTAVAADSLMRFWERKGMDTGGMVLTDGSGLSHYNAVTPRQLVWLLTYMRNRSDHWHEFYRSLAVAGQTGTLEPLLRETVAEGTLRAKSGTISRVKAYAGYVTSASGREIAFSLVVNNFSCSSREAGEQLEQLMLSLAELDK